MNPIKLLTAPNPGPFTGDGTNTYVVGTEQMCVVDPGPQSPSHLQAILNAARGRSITHIFATHAHRDHVDGVAALKAATGAVTVGFSRASGASPVSHAASSPSGGDFVDEAFRPDILIADGARIEVGDVEMEAIHTPGHAPDHLCLALSDGSALFSGDHVMGWSTSVIAPPEGHMGDYVRSLERVVARSEVLYLPGHGPSIPDGPRLARAYLLHRQMREQSILAAIAKGASTIPTIADVVYEGIAPNLQNAARLSVQAHIQWLAERHLITHTGPLAQAAEITIVSPLHVLTGRGLG